MLDQARNKLGPVLDVVDDAENDEHVWVLIGTAGAATTRLVPVARVVEYGTS